MSSTQAFDWEPVVEGTEKLNLTGNLIPHHWYGSITLENGRPDIVAIILLSEVVYWWRPKKLFDEDTGEFKGHQKKFMDDMLQRSPQQLSDKFGFSKRQVQDALKRLDETHGLLKREYRTIMTRYGQPITNVLFVAPVISAISKLDEGIAFIDDEEVEDGVLIQNNMASDVEAQTPMRLNAQGSTFKRDTYIRNKTSKEITQRATASSKVNTQPDDSVKNPAVAFSVNASLPTKQTQSPHQPPMHPPKQPPDPPAEVPPNQQVIGDSLTEFQVAYVRKKLALLAEEDSSIELDRYCQGVSYELVSKTSFTEAGEDFLKKLNTILKYIRAGKWHFPVGLDKELAEQRIAEQKSVNTRLSELLAERDSLRRMMEYANPNNPSQLESLREQLVTAEKRLQVFRETLPSNPTSQQGVA